MEMYDKLKKEREKGRKKEIENEQVSLINVEYGQ
jgi:hypothetical protein